MIETLNKILDFLREYPAWVYVVVLAAFAMALTALVYGKAPVGDLMVFSNQAELTERSKMSDVLSNSKDFRLVALSAYVLKAYKREVTEAIRNGAKIQTVIFDPGPATAYHYDALCQSMGEDPRIKREEATQLAQYVSELQRSPQLQNAGSIELRYLTGKPLLYNLWLSQGRGGGQCGHVSLYFYRGFPYSPSFRSCKRGSLIENISGEFNRVWQDASVSPSVVVSR